MLVIGFLIRLPVIIVSCENQILYEKPLKGEVEMTLEYVHSVERTTVIEVFKIRNDGIYLEKFLWQSFGSGLPSEPINTKLSITEVKGFYCIDNIGKNLGFEITAWFIPENMCKVRINDRYITRLDNGGLLVIRLAYKPIAELMVKQLFEG